MSSTVGKLSEKVLPRYDVLSIPAFTEAPIGQLRSIMTRHQSELGLALVMKHVQ